MKQLLFFLLVATGFAAKAQTETGNFMVGGNLQLDVAKNTTDIQFNPTAGYFFVDNFAAGLNLNIGYSKVGSNSSNFSTTTLGIGPFMRFYTGNATVKPFLDGDVNFESVKNDYSGSSKTSTGITYFVGPGVDFFLNRNVALEVLTGYQHRAYKDQVGNGGFAFKVGFQVFLSRAEVNAATSTNSQ